MRARVNGGILHMSNLWSPGSEGASEMSESAVECRIMSGMYEIAAADAWWNVEERNPLARWKSVLARATSATVYARISDRVGIRREDNVFCIGSCFAKNIEATLIDIGYRVLSHPNYAPRPNQPFVALPNIFNICSLNNEARWALTDAKPDAQDSFVADDQGYLYDPHGTVDAFRSPASVVYERRAGITANMRRLPDCRVVIVTLGMIEVWYDNRVGLYLNATLPRFLLLRDPGRYTLRVLEYDDCLNGLEELRNLLLRHGHPDVQVFVSVSPVPLAATFTADDVLVANTYSKSTLLAAAHEACRRHSNIHYVPSYETVVNSSRCVAWKGDLRHVNSEMVRYVTGLFLDDQLTDNASARANLGNLGRGDWPIDPTETARYPGMPKFFSAVPGDLCFPAGFPKVTTSSALSPQLDGSCLMSASKRIWHSQQPPAYPEWLLFQFENPLYVKRLFIQNQDGHPERSPTSMQFEALTGEAWHTVLVIRNARWRHGGDWQSWALDNGLAFYVFRIRIFANNGDPNLITVQNVYLSPEQPQL
jgi:hypothetical protein